MEGNKRYSSNKSDRDISESRRIKVSYKQKPFAIVLGCSDSRLSPEIIFDQSLGDIFVVRSVAAILDKSIIGSIEFGVQTFHPSLLVVLGHTKCGGVKFALESVQGTINSPREFQYIVDAIQPSIEAATQEGGDGLNRTIKKHCAFVINQLVKSPIVEGAVNRSLLRVVMGWYDITTGVVEFNTQL
jgi:carbonic anhydrase